MPINKQAIVNDILTLLDGNNVLKEIPDDWNIEETFEYVKNIFTDEFIKFDLPFKKTFITLDDGLRKEYYIAPFSSKSAYIMNGLPISTYRTIHLDKNYKEVNKAGFTHIIIPVDVVGDNLVWEMKVGRNNNFLKFIYPYKNKKYINYDKENENSTFNTFEEYLFYQDQDDKPELDFNYTMFKNFDFKSNPITLEEKEKINSLITTIDDKGLFISEDVTKTINMKVFNNYKQLETVDNTLYIVGGIRKNFIYESDYENDSFVMSMIPGLIYIINGRILTPDRYDVVLEYPFGVRVGGKINTDIDHYAIVPYYDPTNISASKYHTFAAVANILFEYSRTFNVAFSNFPYENNKYRDEGNKDKVLDVFKDHIIVIHNNKQNYLYNKNSLIRFMIYKWDILNRVFETSSGDDGWLKKFEGKNISVDKERYIQLRDRNKQYKERKELDSYFDTLSNFIGSEKVQSIPNMNDEEFERFKEEFLREFEFLSAGVNEVSFPEDKRIVLPSGTMRNGRYSPHNDYYTM